MNRMKNKKKLMSQLGKGSLRMVNAIFDCFTFMAIQLKRFFKFMILCI